MKEELQLVIQEIDKCYFLAEQQLLEKTKLEEISLKVKSILSVTVVNLDDEIISLKFKKLNGGLTNLLKPGFHNIQTAYSRLEAWKIFIKEVLDHINVSTKTFKNRLESEGLFIESRSKTEGDIHLIIGLKDGKSDKAHVVVDEKTGEIRVEDNQLEPLDLIRKIESVLTLPTGKKIRVTRESIEEISE